MTERPSMDNVLLRIATTMATRATCNRRQVGAVLALDGRVIASGYNGPPTGMPHCSHTYPVGRSSQEGDGCRDAVHAEANAVAFAARHGLATLGATLYTTLAPCLTCAMLLVNAGVTRVVWQDAYRKADGLKLLTDVGVTVTRLNLSWSSA